MSNETLHRLIDRANGAHGPEVILLRPLTDTVSLGKAWLEAPQLEQSSFLQSGQGIYLIRHAHLSWVGIVLDHREKDLHVYMLPEYRGQHIMSTALRDIILPHLLQDREIQRITINSHNLSSKAVSSAVCTAQAAGFALVSSPENEEDVLTMQYASASQNQLSVEKGNDTLFSQERIEQNHRNMVYHASCLAMLSAEVDLHLGDGTLAETILDLASQVHDLGIIVEDACWQTLRRQPSE